MFRVYIGFTSTTFNTNNYTLLCEASLKVLSGINNYTTWCSYPSNYDAEVSLKDETRLQAVRLIIPRNNTISIYDQKVALTAELVSNGFFSAESQTPHVNLVTDAVYSQLIPSYIGIVIFTVMLIILSLIVNWVDKKKS